MGRRQRDRQSDCTHSRTASAPRHGNGRLSVRWSPCRPGWQNRRCRSAWNSSVSNGGFFVNGIQLPAFVCSAARSSDSGTAETPFSASRFTRTGSSSRHAVELRTTSRRTTARRWKADMALQATCHHALRPGGGSTAAGGPRGERRCRRCASACRTPVPGVARTGCRHYKTARSCRDGGAGPSRQRTGGSTFESRTRCLPSRYQRHGCRCGFRRGFGVHSAQGLSFCRAVSRRRPTEIFWR